MASNSSHHRYRYRLTRLGFHFLFVALFAVVGGSLRGFNLLLILAGLLVGTLILQWRSGRINIRLPRFRRSPVLGGHQGLPIQLRYSIENSGRLLPAWMIQIHDRVRPVAGPAAIPSEEAERPDSKTLIASVGNVPAGGVSGTSITCLFSKRGLYRLGPVWISSSFPFSLIQCQVDAENRTRDLAVYPKLFQLKRGWHALLPPRRGGDGTRSVRGNSHEGEFFGLRGWQSGDRVNHIHWRTTARLGEPAVRQFEQRNRYQVFVIVDGSEPSQLAKDRNADSKDQTTGGRDAIGENGVDHFETVIRLAATITTELASPTRAVSLQVLDGTDDHHPLRSHGGDVSQLMRRLAVAMPSPRDRTAGAGNESGSLQDPFIGGLSANPIPGQRDDVIVISCRTMKTVMKDAERNERVTGMLRHLQFTGRLAWLNVCSPTVRNHLHERESSVHSRVAEVPSADVPHESLGIGVVEGATVARSKREGSGVRL